MRPKEIEKAGVVGGGFMGSGIAEAVARAGIPVVVYEPDEPPLERSRGRVEQSVARAVRGGKLSDDEARDLVDRIAWTTDLEALRGSDVVVEAVTEDPGVKGNVFQGLDALLGPDAVLASNTSSIPSPSSARGRTRPTG